MLASQVTKNRVIFVTNIVPTTTPNFAKHYQQGNSQRRNTIMALQDKEYELPQGTQQTNFLQLGQQLALHQTQVALVTTLLSLIPTLPPLPSTVPPFLYQSN